MPPLPRLCRISYRSLTTVPCARGGGLLRLPSVIGTSLSKAATRGKGSPGRAIGSCEPRVGAFGGPVEPFHLGAPGLRHVRTPAAGPANHLGDPFNELARLI